MVKNKKAAQKELHKINGLQQRLSQLTPKVIDQRINDKWSAIKENRSKQELEDLPIELLDLISKEDLPVEQLIQEGIENIGEVSNVSQFSKVKNIGREFSEAYKNHIFPPFKQSDSIYLELIKILLNYEDQKQEIQMFKEDTVYTLDSYKEQLNIIIENDTNALFRLFQKKEKKNEVEQAKEYIQKNQLEIDAIERQLEGSHTLSMPNSLAVKAFEDNKKNYYKQLKDLSEYQPTTLISNLPYYLEDKMTEFEATVSELSSDELDVQIKEQWDKVKQPFIREELENMSLSILNLENNQPYSIVTLNANGYKNVYDIVRQNESRLVNSGMFSKAELTRLYQDAKEMESSVKEKVFPRFNPDNLRPVEVELLKLIYTRIQLNENIQEKQQAFERLTHQ